MMPNANTKIAIFDFDGTITSKSTTLPFLHYIWGYRFYGKLLKNLNTLITYKLKRINIDDLNTKIIQQFLMNFTQSELLDLGQRFSDEVMPNYILNSAIERLRWHKQQGHFCLLATSAYQIYIDPWATQQKFDAVVSTNIHFEQNKPTGNLKGLSCYGPEKLNRIRELIGDAKINYAYGDSEGDKEMLKAAEQSFYRHFK